MISHRILQSSAKRISEAVLKGVCPLGGSVGNLSDEKGTEPCSGSSSFAKRPEPRQRGGVIEMNNQPDAEIAARGLNRLKNAVAVSQTGHRNVMETDVGHEEAQRPNRESVETEKRNARLCCVSRAFPFLNRAWQLHLADTAIIWTVQTMALHARRDECESYFFASVDQVHATTTQENTPLSDTERQQLYRAAKSVKERLQTRMMADYFESVRSLSRRELIETKPFLYFLRTVAETLDGLRTHYLQAATGADLHRLLARSKAACTLLNLWELGGRDDNETAIPVKALYSDAVAVIIKSENWLKEGRCVFHDGQITNTACQ
jgi:hypothetical protein